MHVERRNGNNRFLGQMTESTEGMCPASRGTGPLRFERRGRIATTTEMVYTRTHKVVKGILFNSGNQIPVTFTSNRDMNETPKLCRNATKSSALYPTGLCKSNDLLSVPERCTGGYHRQQPSGEGQRQRRRRRPSEVESYLPFRSTPAVNPYIRRIGAHGPYIRTTGRAVCAVTQ
jgi:hypothetical protein